MDFDGIALKRKFLMGLEPESIRMTIGETWDGLRSDKGTVFRRDHVTTFTV